MKYMSKLNENVEMLKSILEPLIRKIVREEMEEMGYYTRATSPGSVRARQLDQKNSRR